MRGGGRSVSEWAGSPGRFAEYGPPKSVEGGLKAKSARGAIGESWWSRRFLAVLESFALGARLTRGRAYARRGQVISLEVAAGIVTASVQGSADEPYAATIEFTAIGDAGWARIEAALAAEALHSAALLAGEVPPELEALFADAGSPLFPGSFRDLRMSCSCPDFAIPCKHLAAACYLLAESFDDDPFAILRWRGRDRDSLLRTLRALRGGVPPDVGLEVDPDDAPRGPSAGTALALGGAPLPDAVSAEPWRTDEFWWSPVPLPHRVPGLEVDADLLLRQLPQPAADLGGAELVERLRALYLTFADPAPGDERGDAATGDPT